jgi:flagellar protein FlaE
MSLNPRDYDLDELRKMARERGGEANGDIAADLDLGGVEESAGGSADSSLRQGLYRELLPMQLGGEEDKPYLDSLPEDYNGEEMVFEWLEFLFMHAGYQSAVAALDYYESVGWITEDVESELGDYLVGIEDEGANEDNELDMDDHLLSLLYVAKLSQMT